MIFELYPEQFHIVSRLLVHYYKNSKVKPNDNRHINPNYTVRKIDSVLLSLENLNCKDDLIDDLELFWGSKEKFLNDGMGYCVLYNNCIASTCFSGFVSGVIHSIDVKTNEEFRRQGFAEAAVNKLLKEYLERNITPYWDCTKTNIPSARLAEKVGFSKAFEYLVYEFPMEV